MKLRSLFVTLNSNNTCNSDGHNVSVAAICPHPKFTPFPFPINTTSPSPPATLPGSTPEHVFYQVWQQTLSVPFFLLIILAPLINIKSPTFFTKFNALGTISVAFIIFFVSYKAARWGFHVNFHDPTDYSYISRECLVTSRALRALRM